MTLTWDAGEDLPQIEVRRNGELVGTVDGDATSFVDRDAPAGHHVYELRLTGDGECANFPLSCEVTIVDDALLFEDFDCIADDTDLEAAGWLAVDEGEPNEASTWTVTNPLDRANPPGEQGRPTAGGFVTSDSDFGGTDVLQNTAGTGMSHDLWSPEFSAAEADTVWLHVDVVAQLNNDGDAVFDIDVSTDDGATWDNAFRRVSPGRTIEPLPSIAEDNADGIWGRLHVDLTDLAAGRRTDP